MSDVQVVLEEQPQTEPEIFTEEPLSLDDGTTATRSEIEQRIAQEEDDPDKQASEKAKTEKAKTEEEEPDLDKARRIRLNSKRIGQSLRQEVRDAKARAEVLQAERDELAEKLAAQSKPATPETKRPKLDDFEDPADWEDALAAYHEIMIQQRIDAALKQAAPDEPAKKDAPAAEPPPPLTEDQAAALTDMVETGRERYPDFDAVVLRGAGPITKEMFDAFVDSEQSADIAYYLSSNPEIAADLVGLDGRHLAREIGRIEAGIDAGTIKTRPDEGVVVHDNKDLETETPAGEEPARKPSPSRRATRAPEPIEPVAGGRSGAAPVDPDNLSPAEYRRARESGKLR